MKIKNTLILILFALTLSATVGFAEEGAVGDANSGTSDVSTYMQRRRELMELKEKDPAAFKEKVTELRKNAQKRLDGLKTSDPATYERVMERREKRIEPRFERFREMNPEAYGRMQHHREGLIEKRVEWVRKNDPEKFAEIEKRRRGGPGRRNGR